MKKALFWDFDGTLAHANESFADSLENALVLCGFTIIRETITDFLHSVLSWYRPDTIYPDNIGQLWWHSLFAACNTFYKENGIPADSWNSINYCFRENVIHFSYEIYEDAAETLETCMKQGYVNYVISNNYPELPDVISALGLDHYFTGYFVSASYGYEKPRPEIFSTALQTAGKPDFCCMIGDNPVADILGAKAAGMKTVLVHRRAESEADFHCERLAEIPEWLTQNHFI